MSISSPVAFGGWGFFGSPKAAAPKLPPVTDVQMQAFLGRERTVSNTTHEYGKALNDPYYTRTADLDIDGRQYRATQHHFIGHADKPYNDELTLEAEQGPEKLVYWYNDNPALHYARLQYTNPQGQTFASPLRLGDDFNLSQMLKVIVIRMAPEGSYGPRPFY